MLLEATRVLQEKGVVDPRLVDLGMVFGLGFPESRGGLLYWGDSIGAAQIVTMLGPLEHLGSRMRPTPLLLGLAEEGRRFYDMDD
jgi:3-hydroxyacyl-CoA dehydrogenase